MRPPIRLLSSLILFGILLAACSSAPSADNATQAGNPIPIQPNNPKQAANPAPIQANNVSQAGAPAAIQPTGSSLTAQLSEIKGRVLAREVPEASFTESTPGYILHALGQVQTQTDGKARLDFSTGTLVRLGPDTLFTLQPPKEISQGLLVPLQLQLGRLWVILRGGSLNVETKSGVAAVLGSFMSVSYNETTGILRITCLEGHCSLSNAGGTVVITTGQTAEVTGVNQPPLVGTMTQQDYVDWIHNNPEAIVYVPSSTDGGSTSGRHHPNVDPGEKDVPGTGSSGNTGLGTGSSGNTGLGTGSSGDTGSGGGSGNTSSDACNGGTDNGIPGNGGFNNGNGGCDKGNSDFGHSHHHEGK